MLESVLKIRPELAELDEVGSQRGKLEVRLMVLVSGIKKAENINFLFWGLWHTPIGISEE